MTWLEILHMLSVFAESWRCLWFLVFHSLTTTFDLLQLWMPLNGTQSTKDVRYLRFCSIYNSRYYFTHKSDCEVLWWVCLFVCLSDRMSPEPHAWSLPNFLCTLPMSVARSSSGMFMIGHIAYRREWVFFPTENALSARKEGDRSAQCGRSMLPMIALFHVCHLTNNKWSLLWVGSVTGH